MNYIFKKWILYLVLGIMAVMTAIYLFNTFSKTKEQRDIADNNYKALVLEKDTTAKPIEYQFTAAQLKWVKDSLIQKLDSVRKELKIKDSKLKSLSAISTVGQRTDTIYSRDTLFLNNVHVDTIVGDKWFNNRIILEYPNKIISQPKFYNNEYIILHYKKETVNPPKKFWLFRLFQRKHTIVEVEVIEENPYVNIKSKKFMEIIK
nr:MAG TPA: hypothetical protein [Crassvirales sp.]DAR74784.1 MAG TPA: hypothetical protein [Crassvirales sp.]